MFGDVALAQHGVAADDHALLVRREHAGFLDGVGEGLRGHHQPVLVRRKAQRHDLARHHGLVVAPERHLPGVLALLLRELHRAGKAAVEALQVRCRLPRRRRGRPHHQQHRAAVARAPFAQPLAFLGQPRGIVPGEERLRPFDQHHAALRTALVHQRLECLHEQVDAGPAGVRGRVQRAQVGAAVERAVGVDVEPMGA
ncbi:hypothetical protein D3C81_1511380 [compost metagenome]